MADDVDDGSTKPIGYQTDDGELEVREVNGERMYYETELGQHQRWMRQAPDLFALYMAAVEELALLRARQ